MKSSAIITFICLFILQNSFGEKEQPNIIIVLTDDQGYGDLGAHGHPLLKTPNLDKLRSQSVSFDRFYVSPSCSPTRAALLTGMHEFNSGVTHTQPPRMQLNPNATTLADTFSKNGYSTGFIGKWHLGNQAPYNPENRGFQWTAVNQGHSKEHFDVTMIRNKKKIPYKGFREDNFFDEAFTFMKESKDQQKPFFCYLCTFSPHTPLAAPTEFIEPFKGKCTDDQALYLAMIANIDYNMGRLEKFLTDQNLSENTILIFMNDNGVTVGLDVYNANMRGCKCTIWEGGSRAMSFWKYGDKWKPKINKSLTAHLDVFPTLCDYADIKLPKEHSEKLQGFTLRPLLEEQSPSSFPEDRLLFQHIARWPSGHAAAHKYAGAAVRYKNYLLLQSGSCDLDPAICSGHRGQCPTYRNIAKGAVKATYTEKNAQYHWGITTKGSWSLYDIEEDPGCNNNIKEQHKELTQRLSSAYNTWWDKTYPIMLSAGGDDAVPAK